MGWKTAPTLRHQRTQSIMDMTAINIDEFVAKGQAIIEEFKSFKVSPYVYGYVRQWEEERNRILMEESLTEAQVMQLASVSPMAFVKAWNLAR